ncbi:MAG: hypothetical protein ACKVKF_19875 [Rhodobacterales bacterium]
MPKVLDAFARHGVVMEGARITFTDAPAQLPSTSQKLRHDTGQIALWKRRCDAQAGIIGLQRTEAPKPC